MAIGDDFEKEDQPEWKWVPHGKGWALMQGRHSARHGLNKLTVPADGFDWGGEEMRTLIAKLLNEHAEQTRAEQSAVERLLLLQRAWAPVVRAALAYHEAGLDDGREKYAALRAALELLTNEQREAAKP